MIKAHISIATGNGTEQVSIYTSRMPSIVGEREQADWFSLCTTSSYRMLSIVGETIRCLLGIIV